MKVLIAGSGKTAREILRRLGESWSVTLIDIIPDRLNLLRQQFKQVDRTVLGDASSLVTLKEADFKDQNFVVAITNRDDVNLEVCRLAKERRIKNIAALVNDSFNLKEFEKLGVRTICWSYMAAREIELYLESPRLFLTTTGKGKGEIMEIKVSHYAPVINKKIREFRAANWLIATIYREGELIIPHADTVIQPNDRITVVGHTDLYPAIAHLFKYEEPSFPLAYGQNILAAIEDPDSFKKILPEAFYLVKNTKAQKVILLVPKAIEESILKETQELGEPFELEIRQFQEKLKEVLILTSHKESIGCVLVPPSSPGILSRVLGQIIPISLAHKLASPLLVLRGTYPYNRVLVPYNATQRSALALKIAIDIAKQVDADISVIAVSEPTVIRGEESRDWAEKALDHAREIAQIHKFPIKEIQLEGNPVKEVTKLAKDCDLLVLGSTTQDVPFLKPHIGELLIEKSPCSAMVVAY
jgi:trk system potassium uptake protein TrkA